MLIRTATITSISSTPNLPHTGMLSRPLKYSPVTLQNWRPQVV